MTAGYKAVTSQCTTGRDTPGTVSAVYFSATGSTAMGAGMAWRRARYSLSSSQSILVVSSASGVSWYRHGKILAWR